MNTFNRFFLLTLLSCVSIASFSQETKHVIIISIDGLRPDFYREDHWPTPTLHKLVKEGVSADGVRGVFPSVTYPSHTTILTGAMPARHGIYYNSPFEPMGATGKWYWESNGIKVPTLWEAARQAGLTTASVYWPVSVGAKVDYNIPEIWTLDKTKERTSPQRELSTPLGLYEEIEKEATGKLNAEKLNSDYASADENGSRMVAYLIKKYKPNLLTFHIFSVDHAEHADGRDGEHVRQSLAGADHAVNNILEAIVQAGIKENTTVIVTGDHGFVDIHSSLAPNVWLAKEGLYIKNGDQVVWKAQFHTSGAAAFLMLKDKDDKTTLTKVRNLLNDLPAQQRKLFRVVERSELDRIGTDPNVALALAPIEGIAMSNALTGEVLRPASGGTHGFFPDFAHIQTGFIAAGGNVQKGKTITLMGLEDIAPLVARLLNLNFTAPDGILYPGILKK
ncbi:MAG: ectonucleotide pyrophosphatase/phosphodiesterase [Sediminibacterium sp.]|uniref:alkaline phosphatase family protein n=1 Tax=Sediminibacterium sp. TaxID=1917865 RepID=UPI002AB8D9FA|nr:ectonucleotide pyrophosphatase/phosphodiesterase [Sediminibacterium sp.]MDZ4071019.1 ectonucleotide pyrophosphatase/phosphodiesterase [Sediminibacterium sp.]